MNGIAQITVEPRRIAEKLIEYESEESVEELVVNGKYDITIKCDEIKQRLIFDRRRLSEAVATVNEDVNGLKEIKIRNARVDDAIDDLTDTIRDQSFLCEAKATTIVKTTDLSEYDIDRTVDRIVKLNIESQDEE